MTSITSLPTDNLYKFIAIAGLVVFISGIFLMSNSEDKLAEVGFSVDTLSSVIEDIQELVHESENNVISSAVNNPNQVEEAADAFVDLISERNKLAYRIETINSELELELETIKKNTWRGFALALLGLLTSSAGFYFWYHRIQKYLDIKLKKEALDGTS